MQHRSNARDVKAFSLIELLAAMAISAFLLVVTVQQIIQRNDRAIATGLVARQIAGFTNAVRQRISYEDALVIFDQPIQTNMGISWLQNATCGGTANVQFLPCNFSVDIAQAGHLIYTTEIKNTAGRLSATIKLADANGVGYQAHGRLRSDLAGAAVIGAAGYRVSSVTPTGLVTFAKFESDPTSGIITVEIDTNSATEPWLRTDGSNQMNADLGFSGIGHDLLNANDIEASSMTDKDDNNFWLDPSSTSQVAALNATSINADQMRSDSTIANNAAFGAARISQLETGSIDSQSVVTDKMTANYFVDKQDGNYYIDPNGTSKVRDIVLASRGNIRLSELLPKMVLMSSDWVKNGDLVAKPQCASSEVITGIPKIILVAGVVESYLREPGIDHGQNHTKIAAKSSISAYIAEDIVGSNAWIINLLSWDYEVGDYVQADNNLSRALAQLYCSY